VSARPGTRLVTLGLLAVASSLSVFVGESSAVQLALRVVGVGLIVVAAARSGRAPRGDATWLTWLMASIALYVVVGDLFHGQWLAGLTTLASLVVVTAALTFALPRLDPETFVTACRRVLTTTLVVSLALGVLTPGTALEMNRLRGFYENANGAGFVALALGVLTLLRPSGVPATTLGLLTAGATLVWSASRTSAIALVLVLVVVLVVRRSATLTLIVLAIGVGLLCLWAWTPEVQVVLDGLLRGTDSRSATTDLALEVLRDSPVIGIGIGNEVGIHVSSPLVAFIHAGAPGALAFVGMAAALTMPAARRGWRSVVVTVALLVHSTGESWLLSPISPMLLTAVLLWHGIVGADPVRRAAQPTSPPQPALPPPAPSRPHLQRTS